MIEALDPSVATIALLVLAVGLALTFEFVNGFHDTANAVATVIYTNTLVPAVAVVWSGFCNLIGVLVSRGVIAFTIVAILPVELVINVGTSAGFAMIFSLLVSAMIWNLGTWYKGLPASSTHTLIGSILGVGLANSFLLDGHFGSGVNWAEAEEVGLALLVSPVVGFSAAALLFIAARRVVRDPALYRAPRGAAPPPFWTRVLLVLTCTGVSFAHGSNDGQKGMGLLLLILVGILPGAYALNTGVGPGVVREVGAAAATLAAALRPSPPDVALTSAESTAELSGYLKLGGKLTERTYGALQQKLTAIEAAFDGEKMPADVPIDERGGVRVDLYLAARVVEKLGRTGHLGAAEDRQAALVLGRGARALTEYIPDWVKYAVALALGVGTMVGWKRIVVTVGEKIGKEHMTYAQGASAELVAMATIIGADGLGLPVSTTHVLSSGVAGAMAANHSGLQMRTLRNILLAWVLTLPMSIFLGALLFAFGINLVLLLGLR